MLLYLFCAIFLCKYNHSWFDTLVDVALSERWRHNNHTRQSFLWKAVNAVVVVLVEHPKLKPLKVS